jgi:predicted ATPase
VLRLASVIGRVFLHRVLAEIAGQGAGVSELDTRLLTLQRQQLIRERARVPELEYIFKHKLTREAAHNGLLKRERLIYHRRVAQTLEQLYPEQADEQAGLLAHHWEQAEEPEKAVDFQELIELVSGNSSWVGEALPHLYLGQAYLAMGTRREALEQFHRATALSELRRLESLAGFLYSGLRVKSLGLLDQAYDDAYAFRGFCRQYREEHRDLQDPRYARFVQWYLEPASVREVHFPPLAG